MYKNFFFQLLQRKSMSLSLWRLQQQGAFCDAEMTTSDGVVISSHAVILAAASDHLYELLRNSWSVDECGVVRYRLDMQDCSVDVLNAVLKYIYIGVRDTSLADIASLDVKRSSATTNQVIGFHEICDRFGILAAVTADAQPPQTDVENTQ